MNIGTDVIVEALLLDVGEQVGADANCFPVPIRVITSPAPTASLFGLQSPLRLFKRRTGQGDNVEKVHDRGGVGHHFRGGLLVSGESIHSDVVNASVEGIRVVFQPVGEHVG